jgi:hypothetical protein
MICFDSYIVYLLTGLVVAIIALILFFSNRELETCKSQMKCPDQLPIEIKTTIPNTGPMYPERSYTGRIPTSESSKNIGYIFNPAEIYPLFLYRVDRKYYYHTIDKSRNNVKIPIENGNNSKEIYEGDVITIEELGGPYTVKLYDYSENRYNPYA